MAVVKSGHIQSFVNRAKTARYGYRDAPPTAPDPDQWLSGAAEHEGSWWPKWAEWLIPRSGPEKAAPAEPGSRQYPPLVPAPGTYAHE
jgi:polyhydroxyalkanoate synthase